MEKNTNLELKDNISSTKKSLIINTTNSQNNNMETSETINTQNTENKNNAQNIDNNTTKKIFKLSNLIGKSNSPSQILKHKFIQWKKITFLKDKGLGRKSRKILIKKTLNIHRTKENQDLFEKEKQKIKILKKHSPFNLNEESEKRKKAIKFFESRILSYIKRKDILRKYYDIWMTKALNKEEKSNKKITKKIITKIKIKDNKKNENENIINIKEEKIQNILKYKNPLKIYFNIWKIKSRYKEVETYNKKILIKPTEKEKPSIKIKIVKQMVPKKQKNKKSKRNKKLIKIISKTYSNPKNKDIIRKYFIKWVSNTLNNENDNIIKEDKPIKIITGIENENSNINNIENIKSENEIKIKDEMIEDIKEKQELNQNQKNINEKNIINKIIIKKNIIKEPPKNIKSNISIIEQSKEEKEKLIDLKELKDDDITSEKKQDIKEKENEDNKSIPQISNNEFMLYKILHDEFENAEKNKNNKENLDIDKKNKLENIIKIKNPLKVYFNKWKKIINSNSKREDDNIENNKTKKIITKKKIIYKSNKYNEKEKENDESNVYIIQKEKVNFGKHKKAELKIIDLVKRRISNYLSRKQILKKYYDRWLSKMPPDIIKESVMKKIITKKIYSSKKKKKKTDDEEKPAINDIKKKLFTTENETENRVKMEIFQKADNENEKENKDIDLYEDKDTGNENTITMPEEQKDDEILKNNILRLSLSMKEQEKPIENYSIDINKVIPEEKEEIISENKNEIIEKEYSNKNKKLKNIINKTPLKAYFNRWKKMIYIKTNEKQQDEIDIEIIDSDENVKKSEIKKKVINTLKNIYNKITLKKYFNILKNNMEKDENVININTNKNNEDNIEIIEAEKKDNEDDKDKINLNTMNIKDILYKYKDNDNNEHKNIEYNNLIEPKNSDNQKISQKNNINGNENNCIDVLNGKNIEKELLKDAEKSEIEIEIKEENKPDDIDKNEREKNEININTFEDKNNIENSKIATKEIKEIIPEKEITVDKMNVQDNNKYREIENLNKIKDINQPVINEVKIEIEPEINKEKLKNKIIDKKSDNINEISNIKNDEQKDNETKKISEKENINLQEEKVKNISINNGQDDDINEFDIEIKEEKEEAEGNDKFKDSKNSQFNKDLTVTNVIPGKQEINEETGKKLEQIREKENGETKIQSISLSPLDNNLKNEGNLDSEKNQKELRHINSKENIDLNENKIGDEEILNTKDEKIDIKQKTMKNENNDINNNETTINKPGKILLSENNKKEDLLQNFNDEEHIVIKYIDEEKLEKDKDKDKTINPEQKTNNINNKELANKKEDNINKINKIPDLEEESKKLLDRNKQNKENENDIIINIKETSDSNLKPHNKIEGRNADNKSIDKDKIENTNKLEKEEEIPIQFKAEINNIESKDKIKPEDILEIKNIIQDIIDKIEKNEEKELNENININANSDLKNINENLKDSQNIKESKQEENTIKQKIEILNASDKNENKNSYSIKEDNNGLHIKFESDKKEQIDENEKTKINNDIQIENEQSIINKIEPKEKEGKSNEINEELYEKNLIKDFDENNEKKKNLSNIKFEENLDKDEKNNEKQKNFDEIKDNNTTNNINIEIYNNKNEISFNNDDSLNDDKEDKNEKQYIKTNQIEQIDDNNNNIVIQNKSNQQPLNNEKEQNININPKEIDSIDKNEEKDKLQTIKIEKNAHAKSPIEEKKDKNLKDLTHIKSKDFVEDKLELNNNLMNRDNKMNRNDKHCFNIGGKIESLDKPKNYKNISKIMTEFLDNLTDDILKKIVILENQNKKEIPFNIDYSLDEDNDEEDKNEKIITKQDEINQINNDIKTSIQNLEPQQIEKQEPDIIDQKGIDSNDKPIDNCVRESKILDSKIDNKISKDQDEEYSKNILPLNSKDGAKEIQTEKNECNISKEKQDINIINLPEKKNEKELTDTKIEINDNILIGDNNINKSNKNDKEYLNNLQLNKNPDKIGKCNDISQNVEQNIDNVLNDDLKKIEIIEKEKKENKDNHIKEEKPEKENEIQKEPFEIEENKLNNIISKEPNQTNNQEELEYQYPKKENNNEYKEENSIKKKLKISPDLKEELLLKQKEEIPKIENIEEMNNISEEKSEKENINSNLIIAPEEGDNISKKLNLNEKILKKGKESNESKENINIDINPGIIYEEEKILNKGLKPLEKETKQIIEKEKVSYDNINSEDIKEIKPNVISLPENIDLKANIDNIEIIKDNNNDNILDNKKEEESNNIINEKDEIKINQEEIIDSHEKNKEILDNIIKDDVNDLKNLNKEEIEKNSDKTGKILPESENNIINNIDKKEEKTEKQLQENQYNNIYIEEEIIPKEKQEQQGEKDDKQLNNIISKEQNIINNQNEIYIPNQDIMNIQAEEENINKMTPKNEKNEEINFAGREKSEKENMNLNVSTEKDNNIVEERKSVEKIIVQNGDENNNQEIYIEKEKDNSIEDITPKLKDENDKIWIKDLKPFEKEINDIKVKDDIELINNISLPENIKQKTNYENNEIQENNINPENLDNKNKIEITNLIKDKNNESIEIQINSEEGENSDKNIHENEIQIQQDNIPINNEENKIKDDIGKIMDLNENEKNDKKEIIISNTENNIVKNEKNNLEILPLSEKENENEHKEPELEGNKNKEVTELNLSKEERQNPIKTQEKIEIIKTYSIDDIDESENDNQKIIEDNNKSLKAKTYLNKINKPVINISSSINSESMEKEKSESHEKLKDNNNYIYSKPKNNNKTNKNELEKDINKNKENIEQNKFNKLKELNKEISPSQNQKLSNKDETVLSNNKTNDNNHLTENKIYELKTDNDNYSNERNNSIENNNINIEYIKKIDINNPSVKNKILKLIKIINPLNNYLKKWKENIHSTEIEIPFYYNIKEKNNNKYYNKEIDENDKSKKLFDNENISTNNNIFCSNNKIKGYKDQQKLFVNNIQKRIKLKNKIMKFINNQQKNSVLYYFKNWKDKTLSSKESQYSRIITTSINQNKYVTKVKFIPGKKVLPFEKLESKINQPYKTKTPRPIRNIMNKIERIRKIKILTKLLTKKIEDEKRYPLRKYINIWKQYIQNDKEKNIDKGNANKLISNSDEKKDNKVITYKKRKIKEFIPNLNNEFEDLNNNQKRINTEKNNNLYIKHKAQIPNFISSMKNIINNINEENKETVEDNIINYNNDISDTKEVIKKFILPMPKKEETKECHLMLNPFQRNEEFDEINLNLDIFDNKKTPKIPKIKFKKKTKPNTYKIIHNRNKTTDIELMDKTNNNNNNRYKIINKNIHTYIENSPDNVFNIENNFKTNIEIIHKKIDLTTDSEGSNTISLQKDSPIENQVFGYNKAKVRNVIKYKKITKKVNNASYYDNERSIEGKNYKTVYNNDSKHTKSKSFISDYSGISNEENKKLYLGNKLCKKEYSINYNNLILCEEIIYKSNEAVVEKKLNIKPVKKPKQIPKNKNIINSPIANIISKEKQSIFFQKVMRYKKREMQLGYYNNINKSPMRLPINPNDIELQISTLSPFTKSSENIFKKEIKRFEKIDRIIRSPDICITDRGERKGNLDIFNSPKNMNSYQNNNIFDINDSIPMMDNDNDNFNNEYEIEDEDLRNKINNELKLTKKLADFHTRFMNNTTEKIFNKIQPTVLYNIIKNNNKKLCLLKIFYIYAKYKMNKYLLLKLYLRKWLKAINFIDIRTKENIHIINKSGHCISAKNVIIQEIRCGIHPNNEDNAGCSCLKIRTYLRRILLRHYLLKNIDVRKYYLFKWYKNTFKKIRPLYLIY